MKTVRKVLLITLLIVTVVIVVLVGSVILFQDKIIARFVNEANKQLNTPVRIGKIEVSAWREFPRLAIVFRDVYVEDSHSEEYPLLRADLIALQLDPLKVAAGDYTIRAVHIQNSETTLKINAKGETNYAILKSGEGSGDGGVRFELRDVRLINTLVHYRDPGARQDMTFSSEDLRASIVSEASIYEITAEGQLTTQKISVDDLEYFSNKTFQASSELIYDDVNKNLKILPSSLLLNTSSFDVEGTYDWKGRNMLDLSTKGKDTDIQTLLSLLPTSISKDLEKYRSEGSVYFRSKLKGEISKERLPSLSVEFGFTDATIVQPELNSRIENASMTGSFACGNTRYLQQSALVMKDMKGVLNGENFEADFVLNNLADPDVICNFKGKLDASGLSSFFALEQVKDVSGSLIADIAFQGKVSLLKNKATAQRVSTQGTIDLQDIHFVYGKEKPFAIDRLKGALQFNNNDLALSNVSGKLGNSDFLLNGFFKNIITFMLFDDQPIGVETDLKSEFLDVDQLFELGFGTEGESAAEYTFNISRNINLNFNCDIDALRYKKFNARNVTGDLLVKNQVAVSRNLSFESMGGAIEMSGIVDSKNNKAIDLVNTIRLHDVNVDSAFYVFENFQQDFIKDHHLKGKATAEINMELTLNEHLKMFPETLIADISIVIQKGELNNFEPMQNLKKYLDDEGLAKLRFSDLKNEIHIENKTVYIPQMEIRSNVTELKLSGTHTFSQEIDYRIVTPFRRKKLVDLEAQQAVEETEQGARLFLKITGTTDDYKVAYDTEAVRKKIASDFRKEVEELKNAFRTKGKKQQKEVELQKDEYFEDW